MGAERLAAAGGTGADEVRAAPRGVGADRGAESGAERAGESERNDGELADGGQFGGVDEEFGVDEWGKEGVGELEWSSE